MEGQICVSSILLYETPNKIYRKIDIYQFQRVIKEGNSFSQIQRKNGTTLNQNIQKNKIMQPRFHLSHSFMLNTNLGNPSSLCTLRSLSTNLHSSWFKVEVATGSQKNNNNKTFDAGIRGGGPTSHGGSCRP